MKLNKKGFTLVEILATVAIMAVLSGVAVTATTKYLEKTRQESYKALEASAYSAAQNYIQQRSAIVPVFNDKVTASSGLTSAQKNKLKNKWNKNATKEVIDLSLNGLVPKKDASGNPIPGSNTAGKCTGCFYVLPIKTLIDEEYLDEFKDPKATDKNCDGFVYVTKEKASGEKLEKYTYLVEVECYDYESSHPTKESATSTKEVNARGVFFTS